MTQLDGTGIGRLLDDLVPDLPARPDRLAAVQRGVRRRRRRLVAVAAAATALVLLGVPALLSTRRASPPGPPVGFASGSPPQRPDAGTCPARPPLFPVLDGGMPTTAPGQLAPHGAVRAVWCEYNHQQWWRYRDGPTYQLVLYRDVAGLVTALNKLPVEEGRDPCHAITFGGYLTLEYPDGPAVTIEFAGQCGFVRRGDIIRHDGWQAVTAFDERYRDQEIAAAQPDRVGPAGCAARLVNGPYQRYQPPAVADVWLRAPDRHALPAAAVVVTACRYTLRDPGELVRVSQVDDRAVAGAASAAVDAALGSMYTSSFVICPQDAVPRILDVLVLRDLVGETVEVRILRDTCLAMVIGTLQARPNDGLTDLLDHLLGRPG
jgi:hypothetical protein